MSRAKLAHFAPLIFTPQRSNIEEQQEDGSRDLIQSINRLEQELLGKQAVTGHHLRHVFTHVPARLPRQDLAHSAFIAP